MWARPAVPLPSPTLFALTCPFPSWIYASCRVAATAVVYFRRVYLCNNFCRLDPRLVHVACLYLACKAEESQLAAKHLVVCAKKQRPNWNYDVKDLLDMEMVRACGACMHATPHQHALMVMLDDRECAAQ